MADFSFTGYGKPVEPGPPLYNNVKTRMEGMKIKSRLKSDDPDQQFTLFLVKDTTDKDLIMAHYNGQYGDTNPFYWRTVPTYINNGTDMYVRYKSIEVIPVLYDLWEITIVFDKEII